MAETKSSEETSAVTRWEPLRELQGWKPFGGRHLWERVLPSRMERMMERLFEDFADEWSGFPRMLAPAISLSENDAHYTLHAELPGVRKDDVTVELEDGRITIRGEKRSEREERKERCRYEECAYGAFSRSFPLPSDAEADPARFEASFRDGVLTVTIPKTEEAKPAVIAIK